MLRRNLLQMTGLCAVGGLLAACAAGTTPTVSSVATDVELVDTGLEAILPNLTSVDSATMTSIESWLTQIAAAAKALETPATTTTTTTSAASIVQTVGTYVEDIVTALSKFTLPSAVAAALQAAQVLMPVILAEAGVLAVGPKPLLLPKGAVPLAGMDAPMARLVLRSARVRGAAH